MGVVRDFVALVVVVVLGVLVLSTEIKTDGTSLVENKSESLSTFVKDSACFGNKNLSNRGQRSVGD